MKVGYIRVSKHEQNEALRRDALQEAKCEKYFTDIITGSTFERKGLEKALAFIRPGDTFVVWKLDRLGRSLKDLIETLNLLNNRGVDFLSLTENIDTATPGGKLIFHLMGTLAEFERDLIRERTNAGLAAARVRGRVGGRPRRASDGKVALARYLYQDPNHSVAEICSMLGISRSTFFRYVKKAESATYLSDFRSRNSKIYRGRVISALWSQRRRSCLRRWCRRSHNVLSSAWNVPAFWQLEP